MAFRLHPISVMPLTSRQVFPYSYLGANGTRVEGIGTIASLWQDSEVQYLFQVPETLPTGTAKIDIIGISASCAGNVKVEPKWVSKDYGESIDVASGSLNSEGESTITWASPADDDELKSTKVTLDADTVVAGEFIVLRLAFNSTLWTAASIITWIPSIIWE